ncbi:hypothetical protein OC842_000269 [Tilletia horrida]|uniref:Uncharacterized protein n=1 Tax=Tilletia horrida TaxID=155126 RepID=A0AAN6GJQ2_9BASI|nr:hypothetical protein OC842_000269 [Tilletia horrida]
MPKAASASGSRGASSSSRPGRPQRAPKGGGGGGGPLSYDSAEEALDAAVGIEERAERFARAQGDKARRLFEEALTVYHRAIELGGETYADACYNAGRTALVLATGFYTPFQARPALQTAISHLLSALSARLSNPSIAIPSAASAALLAQVGQEVKTSVAIFEGGPNSNLLGALGLPPAASLPSLRAQGTAADDDSDTADPFVVDIISSTASALQALAELDDHYGPSLAASPSPRAAFLRVPGNIVSAPSAPLTTMVASVRMSALACSCFAHAIEASSIRNGAGEPATLVQAASGTADAEQVIPAVSDGMDDDSMMANEPSLSSTYEGSTNPLTPSGYAEALCDYYAAVSALLSMTDDTSVPAPQVHRPLVAWAVGAGQAMLLEADRLQDDISKANSVVDETEREGCAESLAQLRNAPLLLEVAALLSSETRVQGSPSASDAAYGAQLAKLEAQFAAVAEELLSRAQGPAPPAVGELCNVADAAMSISQLRIRLAASNPTTETATAAWSTATATAKLLVKAYSLLEANDPGGSASAGAGANIVLGSGSHDGKGGLLSERQRTQLSISLSLAQISLLRLHPAFDVLRAAQSAEEARKTIEALRANAAAYSRRALQQAGLRWVVQYADDAGKRTTSSGKLSPQWAAEQALSLEHEERVLHDGWEVLSLRAETLVTALRAGWYKLAGQGESVRQRAQVELSQGGAIQSADQLLAALLQSNAAGAELVGMLECLAALTALSASAGGSEQLQQQALHLQPHQVDKARESREIAQSWAQEVFARSPDSRSTTDSALDAFRVLAELDADDGSLRDRGRSAQAASTILLDEAGYIDELAFWNWVARNLLSG